MRKGSLRDVKDLLDVLENHNTDMHAAYKDLVGLKRYVVAAYGDDSKVMQPLLNDFNARLLKIVKNALRNNSSVAERSEINRLKADVVDLKYKIAESVSAEELAKAHSEKELHKTQLKWAKVKEEKVQPLSEAASVPAIEGYDMIVKLIAHCNNKKALTGDQLEALNKLLKNGDVGKLLNMTSQTKQDKSCGSILIEAIKNTQRSFSIKGVVANTNVTKGKIDSVIKRINGAMDASKEAAVSSKGGQKQER